MWCIYREKNKGKKKEKEKEVCNGHMTVARGRGGSSQRSYDRWGAGGAGWGGARQAHHSGPTRPAILGPPFWACPTRHLWACSARHLGPSSPSSIKPVGWSRALKKLNFWPDPARCPSGPARWRPLLNHLSFMHNLFFLR